MLQWFPNDEEEYVQPPPTASDKEYSGFYGYIQAPAVSNSSVTYHIEFDYGIEYTPNIAYRPFVERKPPTTHPNAYYNLNLFVGKYWDTVSNCTVQQYDNFVSQIEHVPLSLSNRFKMSNQVANPTNLPGFKKMAMDAAYEEDGYCDMIIDKTGFDVCGAAGKTVEYITKTAGTQLLGAITGGGRPRYSSIM
jgi:hypothetical protein